MALIKCNECGKEISDKATQCISCGCPVNSNKDINHSIGYLLLFVVAIVIILNLCMRNNQNGKLDNKRLNQLEFQNKMNRDAIEGDKYNESVKEYFRQK